MSANAGQGEKLASKSRYFKGPEHPVVVRLPLPSLPFRYSSIDQWRRTHAPTFGQHSECMRSGALGLSAGVLRELEAEGVIGTRPEGL